MQLTRRDFLKLGGVAAAALAFKEFYPVVEELLEPEFDFPERAYQNDIPDGTFVQKKPLFVLPDALGVSEEELRLMNGAESTYGSYPNSQVFWLPGALSEEAQSDDDPRVSRDVRSLLRSQLIFRAMPWRDEKEDAGWDAKETVLIQNMLHYASRRLHSFFGPNPLITTGFMRVFRPGKTTREQLRNSGATYSTGLFGQFTDEQQGESPRGCITKTSHGAIENPAGAIEGALINQCDPNGSPIYSIAILSSFADEYYRNVEKDKGYDTAIQEYTAGMEALLTHEGGHAYFGNIKLGKLDNHGIVNVAGVSTSLLPLFGKSKKELSEVPFYYDFAGIEMYPWKLYKTLTGREFYADLLNKLFHEYGTKSLVFTDEQVVPLIEEMFVRVRAPFTYEQMQKSFGSEPVLSDLPHEQIDRGYEYPEDFIQQVRSDASNPEGIVSWWLPFGWPTQIDVMKAKQAYAIEPHNPFPGSDGFYQHYAFLGNGKYIDGPPSENRLAIAAWRRGGRLSPENKDSRKNYWFNIIGYDVVTAGAKLRGDH